MFFLSEKVFADFFPFMFNGKMISIHIPCLLSHKPSLSSVDNPPPKKKEENLFKSMRQLNDLYAQTIQPKMLKNWLSFAKPIQINGSPKIWLFLKRDSRISYGVL